MRRLKLPMKTDTSVGTASGFPIPGAVSFQLHNNYLIAPRGLGRGREALGLGVTLSKPASGYTLGNSLDARHSGQSRLEAGHIV